MMVARFTAVEFMTMKRYTRVLVFLWLWVGLPAAYGESRDESFFAVPAGLEKAVEFWKQVFTVYDTSQLIFFDPADPAKIYSVIQVENEKELRRLINAEKNRIAAAHGVDEESIKSQRGIKNRFAEGLARSGRYIEQMREIFQEQGLPVELTYLPLIESSFNIQARSHAGAVGMWQFIRSTGKRFLRIDGAIDERRDPLEATRAAARLLSENYRKLGNWPLAITAYNHGPEGLSRAVAKVGSWNLVDLIQKYESRTWGFASKNFYAEFLAAVEVAGNPQRYFPGLEYHPPVPLREIPLEKGTTVAALLKTTGAARDQFFEWNPALSSRASVVPRGYRVKVAAAAAPEAILQNVSAAPDSGIVRHRVKRGETLSQIASRYDASLDEITEINGIRKVHFIAAGQELLIPKP
jgi:membrane-bound lytic murein transglycosylase D